MLQLEIKKFALFLSSLRDRATGLLASAFDIICCRE